MPQQGYFVISDITGYTAFLTGSELEHAQDILKTLFDALIDNFKPPLTISNFQGDAILSYAPEGSFIRGQTLLESVENIYFAFAQTRDRVQRNTTCQCQACRNIPSLDLKLFVHHGEYAVADMRGRQELSGKDVILVHRMMKNEVKEKTGIRAYALFTEAAIKALGLESLCIAMHSHSESYEHIGDVPMYVYDLKKAWDVEREQRRDVVTPEEAWLTFTFDLPAPPPLVWDYLTEPEHRLRWMAGIKGITISGKQNGLVGIGSVNHCAHGDNKISDLIITDWRPFEYRTEVFTGQPLGIRVRCTLRLEPIEGGTRVSILISDLITATLKQKIGAAVMKPMFKKAYIDGFNVAGTLTKIIKEDAAAGRIVLAQAVREASERDGQIVE